MLFSLTVFSFAILQLSKPSGSCSSIKRRRPAAATARIQRRRHCARPDCSLLPDTSFFDQLPWISQVESPPECVDIWNIADLSLLPDTLELYPESGIGPVRSRKSSLRSSLADPTTHYHHSSSPFTLPQSVLDRIEQNPRTPPPSVKFNPMNVTFRDLMPVFHPDEKFERSPQVPRWTRPSSPTRS
jgi:hypothetical protein